MHLTLWHIIHCPEKESEKKASKPNREGPKNPFTGKKKKHEKVCRRDTSQPPHISFHWIMVLL